MTASEKPELYRDLARQLAALIAGEPDPIANAANTAALIYHGLPNLNWAGFYFRNGEDLVLGPFQGKPACVARGCAAPPPPGVQQYWSPMCAISRATSLATRIRGPNSSCHSSRMAACRVCSTWIARCSRVSTNWIATAASNLLRFCSFTTGNIPAAKCSAILMTAQRIGARVRSVAEVCK